MESFSTRDSVLARGRYIPVANLIIGEIKRPSQVVLIRWHREGLTEMLALCCCLQQIHGMAKSITIRDVPDRAAAELAARAALSGRSLQEYVRAQLIELARRPDPLVFLERVRERKHRTESRLSREKILSHRDADRR